MATKEQNKETAPEEQQPESKLPAVQGNGNDEKSVMKAGKMGLVLETLNDMYRFAQYVYKGGMAPKGMTPEGIVVVLQAGAEVGLSPMQSIQNIACINGRPAIWGDAALALVRSSGLLAYFEEYEEFDEKDPHGDDWTAVCISKRRGGDQKVTHRFSVRDAKQAKLWGKEGPWSTYPGRMLRWRARGFNLRDQFGDVLKGLAIAEEQRDAVDITGEVTTGTPMVDGSRTSGLAERLRSDAASPEDASQAPEDKDDGSVPPEAQAATGDSEAPEDKGGVDKRSDIFKPAKKRGN